MDGFSVTKQRSQSTQRTEGTAEASTWSDAVTSGESKTFSRQVSPFGWLTSLASVLGPLAAQLQYNGACCPCMVPLLLSPKRAPCLAVCCHRPLPQESTEDTVSTETSRTKELSRGRTTSTSETTGSSTTNEVGLCAVPTCW